MFNLKDLAYMCECGCTKWNLRRDTRIECSSCNYVIQEAKWVTETPDLVGRLSLEYLALVDNITKAKAFVTSDKSHDIGEASQEALVEQIKIMEDYVSILASRIQLAVFN